MINRDEPPRWTVGFRLNIVLQFAREQPVLSQCFFSLTPENFKNRKVFLIFKGADERNIGPNWLVTLGTKGLLSACHNQLRWRCGKEKY